MRKSKRRLFAYVHSHPNNQVMGVTIDGTTGKTIEATILPTKQRVMLALGVGNELAHVHNKYRQKYGTSGYTLSWIDDPGTDERLASLREDLQTSTRDLREHGVHAKEPAEPRSNTKDAASPKRDTGQITTELMRSGAEQAASKRNARDPAPPVPEQQDAGDSNASAGDESITERPHGGFFS